MEKAKRTAIICPTCQDLVFSRTRHDMRFCECGRCAIDGGSDYNKVQFADRMPKTVPDYNTGHTDKELFDDWNLRRDKYGKVTLAERCANNAGNDSCQDV